MQIDTSLSQSLAMDPTQVQQVYANLDKTQSLNQAAEQFEAIFLQLVLKSMHAASDEVAGENGLLSSREQKFYRDMYDSQITQSMAGSGQVGLAEHIVRQLGEGLADVENKFKQLAEPVALDYQRGALSQPLTRLPSQEDI